MSIDQSNAYSDPATSNVLATPGQERAFFLANKIPPELAGALSSINGHNGFSAMPKADQIAALRNIEHISEMQNLLLDQGIPPQDALAGAVNHAQRHLGYGNLSPAEIAILANGYNSGLSEGKDGSLDLDPFEAEQRRIQLMNSYADGLAYRSFSGGGEPATLEEVEDFARKHGLSKDALLDKLAENNVQVKETHVPEAAKPVVELARTNFGFDAATSILTAKPGPGLAF